jgi:hypothetical protein
MEMRQKGLLTIGDREEKKMVYGQQCTMLVDVDRYGCNKTEWSLGKQLYGIEKSDFKSMVVMIV